MYEFRPRPASLASLFPRYGELDRLADTRIAAGRQTRTPFHSIHAKSMVVDDRVAFVGSCNLDPRSENLNTEVGMLNCGLARRRCRQIIRRFTRTTGKRERSRGRKDC